LLRRSPAIELPRVAASATKPSEIRRAWVHRAPEDHVIALFRASSANGGPVPAPWWSRAVARGELEFRSNGFRIEDRIAQILGPRPGWEYVPWAADGESGYWEFMPSEQQSGSVIVKAVFDSRRIVKPGPDYASVSTRVSDHNRRVAAFRRSAPPHRSRPGQTSERPPPRAEE
jgi:hypothetical protein